MRASKLATILMLAANAAATAAERRLEHLGRGVVAIRRDDDVFVSWRSLATDPPHAAFDLYRSSGGSEPVRLNDVLLAGPTCFLDGDADTTRDLTYSVRPAAGANEVPGGSTSLAAGPPRPYLSVPIRTPAGYASNDASAGDLDGDGEYELVLHQAGRGRDNSQNGLTDPPALQAYRLDGTHLWAIDLGRNVREGAHYVTFLVYDFDGDGRAEVVCKTADGTTDGIGKPIGDPAADWRNDRGRILEGPEFLTVFDGRTGAALATANYLPPRGEVAGWGDDYGNRVDRFLACVAYLDGERPSLVMCRGYYARTTLAAWNWRDGKLSNLWTFDSDDGTPGNRAYRGQGNHNLAVADVDHDARDEIVYGSCVIDDDGRGLYSTGLGHGDAMHLTDVDPDRPGLEVFKANGDRRNPAGLQLRDARTGEQLFGLPSTGREGVVRALAADIDPARRGLEMWGKGEGVGGLFDAKGSRIGDAAPRSCNMAVWWDADQQRELLSGTQITKWDPGSERETRLLDARDFGCASNNGSKSTPCLVADLFGDWREEVVWRSNDNRELRIFTTTEPTPHRLVTLMHDPIYRLSVAWQNTGYNQPPHPGFFLPDRVAGAGPE